MLNWVKLGFKHLTLPIFYRFAPVDLHPARLSVWLEVLRKTQDVPGDVVEIGIMSGGTAIFGSKMLDKLRGSSGSKRYLALDTFNGFAAAHYSYDAENLGISATHSSRAFSANSKGLVKRILKFHGCAGMVDLVEADISAMPPDQLPKQVSACLLDVDLSKPTYDGLKKIWPRLSPGGVIVVDDCSENNRGWRAIKGYRDFCAEERLPEEYQFNAGIVRKPAAVNA